MDRLNEDVLMKTIQTLQAAHQAEVEEFQREIVRLKNYQENREDAFYRAWDWDPPNPNADIEAMVLGANCDLKVIGTCENPHCGKSGWCSHPREYKRDLYQATISKEWMDFKREVSNAVKFDCPCGKVICHDCSESIGDMGWKAPDEIYEIEDEEERDAMEDAFFEELNAYCFSKGYFELWCSDCYIKHVWNK